MEAIFLAAMDSPCNNTINAKIIIKLRRVAKKIDITNFLGSNMSNISREKLAKLIVTNYVEWSRYKPQIASLEMS